MNKKDRIAVVISILVLFFSALDKGDALIVVAPFVLLYWSYRFIKNDISFLKVKDE